MGTKNTPGKFDCYANAKDDEPLFVLLGRDAGAPRAILKWAASRMYAIAATDVGEAEKIAEALRCAGDMIVYRARMRKETCERLLTKETSHGS